MHGVYEEFRNGGWPNLVIVFFGMLGLVLGIAAAVIAALQGRAARPVGATAAVLAVAILSMGALGVMLGHRATDRALAGAGISATMTERIQREGYLEAKSCAKFGLGAALVPLLGGAIALLVARRRKDEEPAGLALPGALLAVAVLVAAGDAALVLQKVPGRDYAVGDPIWRLFEAEEEIDGGRVTEGCRDLEDSIGAPGVDGPGAASSRLPDFSRLAGICVDARIDAALTGPASERREALGRVLVSAELLDDAHRKRIDEEIARLPPPSDGGEREGLDRPWGPQTGPVLLEHDVKVSGRLPIEVIHPILRQQYGHFRRCYEPALAKHPGLAGDVRTRFVIGATGEVVTVANASSTLPDAGVVACVQALIKQTSYPAPEGGVVTVVYPLLFAPRDPTTP